MSTTTYIQGTCSNIEIKNLVAGKFYLLTQVPDASILVTPTGGTQTYEIKNAVSVHIDCCDRDSTHDEQILLQSYVTADNYVEIVDLFDMLKYYLENQGISWCQVTLSAIGKDASGDAVMASVTFYVFYEAVKTECNADSIDAQFMLSHNKRILFKDAPMQESVYWYMKNSDAPMETSSTVLDNSISVIAACVLADGTTASVTASQAISTDKHGLYTSRYLFSYNTILSLVKGVNSNVSEVKSFRLEHGSRVCSYMVVDEYYNGMPVTFFSFRNEFGFAETIALPGVTKVVNDVSQSEAISRHTRVVYDRELTQSFEFQSAALPRFVERSLQSMLLANELQATDKLGNAYDVVITDSDCEMTDDVSAVNSVKLTYKFKSDIPLKEKQKKSTEVFNDTYDNTYG